ncbi:long-chain fatty acid--CoA ligase [Sphingobium algorifonticola]|uniref:3-methylmercaptopropionyl-CoA ligase n=1 Tax=Sphingobium algorifonticola TaxID=2008318 RepID=A0A437J6T5_9SPHN|nr:long-chain fatty acid--CoA ligase [Sphingobium algorifonticola]RVT40757.1 fatty-acid--CoA ligase [Sphingobium algorifonticola]
MIGGMQDFALRLSTIIDHAAREYGLQEVVSVYADGLVERSTWGTIHSDARRFARHLVRQGVKPGDRVATLAMNHGRHVSSWYGATGMGAVLHTINPRLFEDQIAYIANHAEDRVLLYDATFAPLVERLKPRLPSVTHFIRFDGTAGHYADAIADEDDDFAWAQGDERDPCMLCYTSGTTGNPKGVLYSHRSSVLHAMTAIMPACFGLGPESCILPVVPQFHVCGWGIPFAAPMAGSKLVLSAVNDPALLCRLMHDEKVTHSAAVPTVWLGVLAHADATGVVPPPLTRVVIGGSAAPGAMVNRLMDMGIGVSHLWGMTELSPIGTVSRKAADFPTLPRAAQLDLLAHQGGVPYGVEMRLVDDDGAVLPRDGKTAGRLQVRGPWVIARYFGDDSGPAVDADNWFDTGDVAIIRPDGIMQIKDRAKDVIKSGGEWISSVILENEAIGCPGVAEAAAIGLPHPKWDERPILIVVRKGESDVSEADIRAHLATRVAKWWLPDRILFADSLPHTATGKLLKTALRETYASVVLAD